MNVKEIVFNAGNYDNSANDRDYWKLPVNVAINLRVLSAIDLLKSTRKRPLGRLTRRWEDNIRMDLKEIGVNTSNWIDSTHNRYYWRAPVNTALNLRVP